jgi:RNA polymerase sigma-70 factor (ECF subfamily)
MDNYQGYTDAALLALIADGDNLAFAEVYRRYKSALFLHARRILGNDEEAKDVLQELFTTLWTRRSSIDLKTNLSAYLYASVRDRVFDIIAHRKIEEKYIASLATLTGLKIHAGLACFSLLFLLISSSFFSSRVAYS